jgi:hypothetical protein
MVDVSPHFVVLRSIRSTNAHAQTAGVFSIDGTANVEAVLLLF